MWYEHVQALKNLGTSETEVAQLVKLKQTGVSDETCIALITAARAHQHPFASAESVLSLGRSGLTEPEILEIARMDKLDALSGDVVILRLTGFSTQAAVHIARRRAAGQPTLSSPVIARLKDTGLSEAQILERIDRGMTDVQAEAEIAARRRARNPTGFVRNRGRRPR
jgi:alkylhydroperoxidase family enzyme